MWERLHIFQNYFSYEKGALYLPYCKKIKGRRPNNCRKPWNWKVFTEHNLTEENLIKEIINKKKPVAFKNETDREKVKNKILRYLQNKGYNWDIISFLVDEEFKVP